MSIDLILMLHFLGVLFNRRFNDEDKIYEKETNVKFYHVCSRNRLKLLFSIYSNESISSAWKTIPLFHEFVPKVCILYRDGSQAIGHLMRNSDSVLRAKVISVEEELELIQIGAPMWNKYSKEHTHYYAFNSSGHTL